MTPLLRDKAAAPYLGIKVSQYRADVARGLIPQPIRVSPRLSVWMESEIAALQAARVAGKTPDEVRELVKKLEADRKRQA